MAKKELSRRSPIMPQILCGLALCFTVFIFGPIDMYVFNSSNFWFTLKDFVPLFLGLFAAAFVILQILFLGLRLLPRALHLLSLAALTGTMVAIYIQGNYLCLANEVMGGAEPQWNTMLKSSFSNLLIWAAIILVFIGFMVVKPKSFLKVVSFVSGLILIMEGTALAVTLINQSETDTSSNYVYYSDLDQFTCSQNGDVLVFLVDTLDTRLFDRIMEENPDYLRELEGFTYYRNASSSYRKTDPSVVSILTGYLCRNERPFFDDVTIALEQGTFLPTLKENGLTVNIYAGPSGLFNSATMKQVDNMVINEPEIGSEVNFVKTMMQMLAYRFAPTVLQPYVYGEYRVDFNECKEIPNDVPSSTSSRHISFKADYQNKGITVDNDRRFFKLWKMQGAHTPYNTDRNGNNVKAGSVDTYEQSLGAFSILSDVLVGLKENGVYDNATIIIMADHGDGWKCNPTVLVKYPKSDIEGIILSDAPVELLDVRATALYGAGLPYEKEGTPMHMWEGVTDRERLFYVYNWAKPEGFDFYLDTLQEYAVPADATNLDEYKATGVRY